MSSWNHFVLALKGCHWNTNIDPPPSLSLTSSPTPISHLFTSFLSCLMQNRSWRSLNQFCFLWWSFLSDEIISDNIHQMRRINYTKPFLQRSRKKEKKSIKTFPITPLWQKKETLTKAELNFIVSKFSLLWCSAINAKVFFSPLIESSKEENQIKTFPLIFYWKKTFLRPLNCRFPRPDHFLGKLNSWRC